MVAAVRVHKIGGPEVLTYEDVEVSARRARARSGSGSTPAASISSTPISASGMYPSPVGLPFIAGNEGAGEVIAVGPGVTDFKLGDRVAYVGTARRLCGRARCCRPSAR